MIKEGLWRQIVIFRRIHLRDRQEIWCTKGNRQRSQEAHYREALKSWRGTFIPGPCVYIVWFWNWLCRSPQLTVVARLQCDPLGQLRLSKLRPPNVSLSSAHRLRFAVPSARQCYRIPAEIELFVRERVSFLYPGTQFSLKKKSRSEITWEVRCRRETVMETWGGVGERSL